MMRGFPATHHLAALGALAFGFASTLAGAEGKGLVAAATRGDIPTVNALLKAGADVNKPDRGNTALMMAARLDRLDVVRALLAAGADVDAPVAGRTVLLTVAQTPDVELIQTLIAAKADLNVQETFGGRTPLMLAIEAGHLNVARALIDAGANVHAHTKNGVTALMLVAGFRGPDSVAIVKSLLAAHVNVNAGYPPIRPGEGDRALGSLNAGDSALGRAAATGSVEVVQALLVAGAEVNVRQRDWNTPLTSASAKGRADVVRLLLDAKADVTAEDANGKTALALAVQNGHQDVAELLRSAAATARVP